MFTTNTYKFLTEMNIELIIIFGLILVFIGFIGFFLWSENILMFLISNEIAMLGFMVLFSVTAYMNNDINGQIFTLVIIVVSAVETALIFLFYIRLFRSNQFTIE